MIKYLVKVIYKNDAPIRMHMRAKNINNLRRTLIKQILKYPPTDTKIEIDLDKTDWLEPMGYLYHRNGNYRWKTFGKPTEYIVSKNDGRIKRV